MPTRARLLITLAWPTLALHGLDQALAMLADSRAQSDSERLRALSWIQEAVVHVSCQDWHSALAALEKVGDGHALLTPGEDVAARINGGLAHLSLLELGAARADLRAALEVSVEHGLVEQEFKVRHNLGCLEYYAGHLPEAIRLMREADEMTVDVGRVRAQHDLALVLLEVGLLDQARETLGRALAAARRDGHRLEEADLRLDLATTALLRDDLPTAREHLDAAVAAFRARGAGERRRSAALLRASVSLAEGVVPRGLDRTLAPWLRVERPVTPDERLAVRVHVESLLARGSVTDAGYAVQRLRGRARQGFAADMHDRLLIAKVAAAEGDRPKARRVVRTAMHRLTQRQAPSQSLEIRSALALHGRRLADFDVDDALASGSATRVFEAVERWRAVSHRLPLLSAPEDERSAELVAELRLARRESASPGDDGTAARARAAELEWEVSRLDWSRAEQDDVGEAVAPVGHGTTRELLRARGEQALVWVAQGGEEFVVVVTPRGSRLHHVGSAVEVAGLADRLIRDLRAHAFAATNPAMEAAVGRAVAESVAALDERLLTGLQLAHGPVVVVPGRTLMAVPWGMLPGLAGRPVTVAPSVTRWSTPLLTAGPVLQRPLSVTALTGPRLARAAAESAAVVRVWEAAGAAASDHRSATAQSVRDALGSAGVVHVAAHGTHEPQSPWFSSLHMADGPVFAHELPRPATAPHVVLSACDVGRLDPRPGDEPLGLTAALLGLGVRSVVAPVAPVSDVVAAEAMVAYHRELAGGRSASEALAATLAEHPRAGAFCLYGTDWRPEAQIQRAGSLNIAS
ncbi:CHAT domain-containing protein [Pedococcus dokdonensis]|uniref:CHAT domain-containing protein n=1 Tax=Pedococcus dokdonensis TaxID=443156 RepID=A0A1H0U0Z0_9MICO|nr:CHAT domain-containing protein [Pedococcus dokdonensis]SDP59801.1 CHAT domain-containing protein [Pedococcus dokdonensis]